MRINYCLVYNTAMVISFQSFLSFPSLSLLLAFVMYRSNALMYIILFYLISCRLNDSYEVTTQFNKEHLPMLCDIV